MDWEGDERELKAAGAEALGGGRVGFLIRGWEIESCKRSILNSSLLQQYCLLTLLCVCVFFSPGVVLMDSDKCLKLDCLFVSKLLQCFYWKPVNRFISLLVKNTALRIITLLGSLLYGWFWELLNWNYLTVIDKI